MPFDHNDHYHRLLPRHVPRGARRALDVGCGTGRFARRLAERGVEVDAIDASWPVSLAAVPINAAARLAVAATDRLTGRRREPRPPVAEPAMTLAEIRARSADLLPGARVRRLLFWRYLLVYREPTGGDRGR